MLGTFRMSDSTERTWPKCKHFEWGGFCLKGYQSPNILEHFLEHFMRSLYLDVELQSTIHKILFSTVFAFLVKMLLGQQIGQHSFGSFLGKELMHSGKPIQTICRMGSWYDRDSQLDSWIEQEKWDINTDVHIWFVHCLWYSALARKIKLTYLIYVVCVVISFLLLKPWEKKEKQTRRALIFASLDLLF